MARLLIAVCVVLLPATVEAQEIRSRKPLKVGIICSVIANIFDAHSTWNALNDPALGLVEGNILGAFETNSWEKLLLAKVPVTIGTNWIAAYIYDDHPRWSNLLTYGDCALKGGTAIGNYIMADRARDRLKAQAIGFAMKVSW